MNDNARIEWIDALRGLGALLVVMGHLKPAAEIERYIYSVHVFLFFAISGYLFRESNVWTSIKKKAKRLVIPYTFWAGLAVVPLIITAGKFKVAARLFFMLDGEIGWNRPIWFLVVLFVAEILYGFLRQFVKHANIICLMLCPVMWYMLKGHILTMKLDVVPLAVFFLSFGNVLRTIFDLSQIERNRKLATVLILPISILIHIFCVVTNKERVIFTYSQFGRYDLCLLAGMAGVVSFFVLFKALRKNSLLAFFGKYSMLIMCGHYYLLHLLKNMSVELIGYDLWNTRGSIKAVLISFLIAGLIACLGSVLSSLSVKIPKLNWLLKWAGV